MFLTGARPSRTLARVYQGKEKELVATFFLGQVMQDTSVRHLQGSLQKRRKQKAQLLFIKMSYQVIDST